MKHVLRGFAAASLLVRMLSCAGVAAEAIIPFVSKPPDLRGDLSDPAWRSGALLTSFTSISETTKPIARTEARLLYDSKFLYIGVRCEEPNPENLIARVTDRDGPTWQDDCIEVLLDTANAHAACYHIMINSIGTVADERCVDTDRADAGWNINCRAKTGRIPGAWTLEVAIPFKDLGVTPAEGLVWGMNVCRARPPASEYSAWSPTPGGFVQPNSFGHVVLGDSKGIKLLTWGNLDSNTSYGGRNVLECLIPNTGRRVISYDLLLKGDAAGVRRKVTLAPDESATVRIPYKPSGSTHESFVFSISSKGKQVFLATHPAMVVPPSQRVWQLADPLFEGLLSKNPPGEQKNGVIYWFHAGDADGLRSLAKEYGLRYSLDEQYQEMVDCRFMPVSSSDMLMGEQMSSRFETYPFKAVFEPYYRNSRDKGAPQIDGLPYILDPRSREYYFQDLRDTIAKHREHIYAIYTYDEMVDKAVEQGPEFFARMKDTYPLMRDIDERVRKECGYGKYGMPQSPNDPDPFRWIAYRKWVNLQLLDWQKDVYETVQRIAPEIKVISMDATAGHKPFALDRITPYVDIVTHQTYPMGNPNLQEVGFVTKFVADLTGRPVWPCTHVENYAYSVTAEEAREMMSQVMRNGGKGFHLYIPDVRGGRAASGDTMLAKYGCPERYRMITSIVKTVERMNEVAVPTDPDSAIFYSEDHFQSLPAGVVFPNEPQYAYTFLGPVARSWFKFVNDNMVEDGRADLGRCRAVFVPVAKYERRAVVEKLVKYVEAGGTLILGSPECFSLAPDGSSLDDLRHKLIGRSSPSGDPSIIRNRIGKGKVITFAANPFTSANVGDPKWRARFMALAKGLGLKIGRDIWRFKFPEFKNVYQRDPRGVCLTGNYVKWHQERPTDICNADVKGTYTYSIVPDGIADRSEDFRIGKLMDRKKAPVTLKKDLKPEDYVVSWKSGKPVVVTFDFGAVYPVERVHLWYSDQLPALTVEGGTGNGDWTALARNPRQPPTEDVLDVSLTWKPRSLRYLRLSFGERDPGQAMTLAECEVWAQEPK